MPLSDNTQKARIILDGKSWKLIQQVNADINNNTTYKSDIDLYKTPEFWAIADGEGDCEDYVLAKRKKLREAGLSKDVMRMATCWVETGEYHAVLLIETDHGTLCLDNRQRKIYHFQDLPYQWHMVEDPGKQWWRMLRGADL